MHAEQLVEKLDRLVDALSRVAVVGRGRRGALLDFVPGGDPALPVCQLLDRSQRRGAIARGRSRLVPPDRAVGIANSRPGASERFGYRSDAQPARSRLPGLVLEEANAVA